MLASKDELRRKSISTWRRVQVVGAVAVVAMGATLLLPQFVAIFAPFWMIGFLFAGGSLVATEAYKLESRHKYWSAAMDQPSLLHRLIIRDEIK